MPAIISAFNFPLPGLPPAPGRRPAMDRRKHLSVRQRCWWGGHTWNYRMSTQRVIIKFRECARCGEVEIQVG